MKKNSKHVLINAIVPSTFQAQIKKMLIKYKDVFAWSYKVFQEKHVNIKLNS
jgi:hypothetical protein